MWKSYHNHTWRCKHAEGDVEDYCSAALTRGVPILGISDHTPFPDDRWLFRRMSYYQLDQYMTAIDKARERHDDIIILKSMECDYVPEFEPFFHEELLMRHGCDYLIGSVHWFPSRDGWIEVPDARKDKAVLREYTDYYIMAMNCRDFLFMAHPDIFGFFYTDWDAETEACSKAILAAAEDMGVFLEINSHGLRKSKISTEKGLWTKYPVRQFWELAAQYRGKVVVSSDAHRPEHVTAGLVECYDMVEHLGLEVADLGFAEGSQRLKIEGEGVTH